MKSLALKISLAAAVLAILGLALIPKIIGISIESVVIGNLSAIIPPEVQSQFEIRHDEFTKGWFNSSTTIEIIYTPSGADAIVLSMNFDIGHGPLLRTEDGLSAGLAYAAIQPSIRSDMSDIADLSFPLPDITLNLMARFNQSLSLDVIVGELRFSDITGEINFDGLDMNVDVAADQSAYFSAQMGELSATENAANSNVLITGMTLTSSTTQMNNILAKTRATLSVPSISSTLPLPFSISNIGIDYCLQASPGDENFSEIYQTIRLASIESEIPVSSFSWLSEIKQVNNGLLRDYYRLLSELQNQINADAVEVSANLTEMGQKLYLLALQNMLKLHNRIEVNSYDGDHTADLNILWAGLNSLNTIAELDINAVIAALNITLDISLDLEAILSSPLARLVDPYMQEGYLTVSNGRVMMEASLQNSVLRVNGDELPLDQFF